MRSLTHLRNRHNDNVTHKGGFTVVWHYTEGESVAKAGWAKCSPKDNFDRKEGRFLANGRLYDEPVEIDITQVLALNLDDRALKECIGDNVVTTLTSRMGWSPSNTYDDNHMRPRIGNLFGSLDRRRTPVDEEEQRIAIDAMADAARHTRQATPTINMWGMPVAYAEAPPIEVVDDTATRSDVATAVLDAWALQRDSRARMRQAVDAVQTPRSGEEA